MSRVAGGVTPVTHRRADDGHVASQARAQRKSPYQGLEWEVELSVRRQKLDDRHLLGEGKGRRARVRMRVRARMEVRMRVRVRARAKVEVKARGIPCRLRSYRLRHSQCMVKNSTTVHTMVAV